MDAGEQGITIIETPTAQPPQAAPSEPAALPFEVEPLAPLPGERAAGAPVVFETPPETTEPANLKPSAAELAALQPSADEMREIEELEALQEIARRFLSDPAAAENARHVSKGAQTVLDYLALYIADHFPVPEPGGIIADESIATDEERIYTLCRTALSLFDGGPISLFPEAAQIFGTQPSVALQREKATLESQMRQQCAQLAEQDREIARLNYALAEARAALERQEQEMVSRAQAQNALQALQQPEDSPHEKEHRWWQFWRRWRRS